MTDTPKLTKAQQRVLDEVNQNGTFVFASRYKPAEKLAELGLVTLHKGSFGGCWLSPKEPTQ